jgi:hypothetical protein
MGLAAPQTVSDAPEPWPGLDRYLAAFYEVSEGRGWIVGMAGATPLPITAGARMDCAAERGWDVGSEAYEEFAAATKALDKVWLEEHAKRKKK